jgi:predicted O-methyltransferase YrrM
MIESFIESLGSDSVDMFGGLYRGGIYLQQDSVELGCLVRFLEGRGIKGYLEIGSAAGGSVYVLNHYLGFGRIAVVDNNVHVNSKFRSKVLEGIKYEEYIGNSVGIRVEGEFDLVFIDGDHKYEGVKGDTLNFIGNLKRGGYMVFHDIAIGWGAQKWTEELKKGNELGLVHIIDFIGSRKLGTGVFQKI